MKTKRLIKSEIEFIDENGRTHSFYLDGLTEEEYGIFVDKLNEAIESIPEGKVSGYSRYVNKED